MQKQLLILITLMVAFAFPSIAADHRSDLHVDVRANNISDDFFDKVDRVNAFKSEVKAESKRKEHVNDRFNRVARYQSNPSKKKTNNYYNIRAPLKLKSSKAIVINQLTGETIYEKNKSIVTPIASVTKLMTAMVALDAHLPMSDYLTISQQDIDSLKGSSSRLRVGTKLTRGELLQLALMSSENRAASALSRYYPGGKQAFIDAMNTKAAMLGMRRAHFVDPTGLNSRNVATASDLVTMVNAAYQYEEIRNITTTASQAVIVKGRSRPLKYVNTNALVRGNSKWDIGLSKTGYISEAGRCLVMQAEIAGEPMIIVLLDSNGKNTRLGDANRIRKWFELSQAQRSASVAQLQDING